MNERHIKEAHKLCLKAINALVDEGSSHICLLNLGMLFYLINMHINLEEDEKK
jgi:hypothetical protein